MSSHFLSWCRFQYDVGHPAEAAEVVTGARPVQATGDVTATQPGEAPGSRVKSTATMTATWAVETRGTGRSATQPIEDPGARMATHPVEARHSTRSKDGCFPGKYFRGNEVPSRRFSEINKTFSQVEVDQTLSF